MSIKGLEWLDVWKRAMEFAVRIYGEVLPLLPVEEKFSLNQQLRRAAQSIPANLAEGYGRYYYQEAIRFTYIARGSLEETLSHLVLAFQLACLPEPLYRALEQEGEELTRMINGYIAYLKRSKQGANEPGSNQSLHELSEDYITDLPDDLP